MNLPPWCMIPTIPEMLPGLGEQARERAEYHRYQVCRLPERLDEHAGRGEPGAERVVEAHEREDEHKIRHRAAEGEDYPLVHRDQEVVMLVGNRGKHVPAQGHE